MGLCAAMALVWMVVGGAAAFARSATVEARAEAQYGRMIFALEAAQKVTLKQFDTIFVLGFPESIAIDLRDLDEKLARYISLARQDADGRSLRFAMTDAYKVVMQEAGRKLIVDLLPAAWRGPPPPLLPEIVAELAAALEAERAAKAAAEAALRVGQPPLTVALRVAHLPTFSRVVFDWSQPVTARLERDGASFTIEFAKSAPIDLSPLTRDPPVGVRAVRTGVLNGQLIVSLGLNPGAEVRSFYEGASLVVDITPGAKAAADQAARAAAGLAGQLTEQGDAPAFATGFAEQPASDRGAGSDARAETGAGVQVSQSRLEAADEQPARALADIPAAPAQPRSEGKPQAVAAPPEAKPQETQAAKQADYPKAANAPADRPLSLTRDRDRATVTLPLGPTEPIAAFMLGQTLYVVADGQHAFDAASLAARHSEWIASARAEAADGATVLSLTFHKPQLAAAEITPEGWQIAVGDLVTAPAQPLALTLAKAQAETQIKTPWPQSGRVHWLTDPHTGDRLAVVTASPPVRRLIKPRALVQLEVLPTLHGLAVRAIADDVTVRLGLGDLAISAGSGLIASSEQTPVSQPGEAKRAGAQRLARLDFGGSTPKGAFYTQLSRLENALATADQKERRARRLDIVRFYLSHKLAAEGLATVSAILAEDPEAGQDPNIIALRGIANALLRRVPEARADLESPALVHDRDAALWRGHLAAVVNEWPAALDEFRIGAEAFEDYPASIQIDFRLDEARAGLETGTLDRAGEALDAIGRLDVPAEDVTRVGLMRGAYLEAIGRTKDALVAFDEARAGGDRPVAAEAKLRAIKLRLKLGEMEAGEAAHELELLAALWRGDDVELKAQRLLAEIYIARKDYRAAFLMMKNAVQAFPKAPLALRLQDDMREEFRKLYLQDGADALKPVEALSLFYDYREMTPIGRDGDEMIRRLADRLIAVDLLDQATELLDHQVANRLRGAARAQVATRLAMVHLMNHKPELALRAIRMTRQPELPVAIIRARDFLEARALSDLGRVEGALDILNRYDGPEAARLKAEAHWNAQAWGAAGLEYETMLGDRWQSPEALDKTEQLSVLKAAIAYALDDDRFALDRLTKKFYDKMMQTPHAPAFVLITAPVEARGAEFSQIARELAAADTLDAFMAGYRQQFDAILGGTIGEGADG